MQFALLIYHSPGEFGMRKNDYNDPHLGVISRIGPCALTSCKGSEKLLKLQTLTTAQSAWPKILR